MYVMNNDYEQIKDDSLKTTDYVFVRRNSFLGYTLLWFAFCMTISFGTAFVCTLYMEKIAGYFANNVIGWIIGGILTIILLFVYMFLGPRMHIGVSIPMVMIIMMGFGLFALSIPLYYAKETMAWWKLYLVLFLPAGFMFIMGALAATNKVDLSKIWIPIIAVAVTMLILGIVTWFVFSKYLVALISALGVLLMALYMGFDWYFISKYNKVYNNFMNDEETKKEMIKLSLFFGFKLAYDYIYCVLYLIRLFSNMKN